MEDAARFQLASTQSEAEGVLAARRVRWLLLNALDEEIRLGAAILGVPEEAARASRHVGERLFDEYGLGSAEAAALDGFRLVDEEAAFVGAEPWKLFEAVRGARLVVTGARSGVPVEALMVVTTPMGRRLTFAWRADADAAGRAELRVPYATGLDGRAMGSACLIQDGSHRAVLEVPARAVLDGERLEVALR